MTRNLLFCLFLLLSVISCKKDNKPNTVIPPSAAKNELNANTVVVNAADLVAIDEESLTITARTTSPEPGKILVAVPSSTAPDGFFRKVVSVTKSGNQFVIKTVNASINEVFKEVHISYRDPDYKKIGKVRNETLPGYARAVDIAQNGLKIAGKLNVNLKIMAFDLDYDSNDNMVITSHADFNSEGSELEIASAGLSKSFFENGYSLGTVHLPIVYVEVPVIFLGLPLLFTVPLAQTIDFKFLPITISGKAKWKMRPLIGGGLGVEYSNKTFKNLSSFTSDANVDKPERSDFTQDVEFAASAVIFEPEYEIQIKDFDPLNLHFSLPNTINFKISPPAKPDYKLTYELSVKAGIFVAGKKFDSEIKLVDKTILEGNWDTETVEYTSTAALSQNRADFAAAGAGDKILFAGGIYDRGDRDVMSDVVDIYDVVTNSWSVAHLSQARRKLAATSLGDKIFFGGGEIDDGYSSRVDIYDTRTGKWSTAELSEARMELSAASAGNAVIFAGGDNGQGGQSAVADIYDAVSGNWSTAKLSKGRRRIQGAGADNKIVFAGGGNTGNDSYGNYADIYDVSTKKWTLSKLSVERLQPTAGSAGKKIIFGGNDKFSPVDIFDTEKNTWSTSKVIGGDGSTGSASLRSKILLAGGDDGHDGSRIVEVYDVYSNSWTTVNMSQGRYFPTGAAAGKKILFAGGYTTTLDRVPTVDIFTLK